jgi:hypothetical protein
MVLIKANKNSEAGVTPNEKLLSDMGEFNEELAKAGIMLAGEGLQPSSRSARVRFSGEKRTVIDGTESEIEIRPVFEMEDFGAAVTPEIKAQEDRVRAQVAARQHSR